MTYLVTPSLFVGRPPRCAATPAADARQAADLILAGGTALLPDGNWDQVRDTLRLLGLDEPTIAERIHYARTARVLPQR